MATPLLYHYTSLEAFRAIIGTARIHATHYLHLDDTHEVQLGAGELLEAVKRHKSDDSSRAFQEYLIPAIEEFTTSKLDVFVLSLTNAMDSKTHWERYASQGVAIGFDQKAVFEGFQCDMPRPAGAPGVDRDPSNRPMRCRYAGSFDLQSLVAERFFGPKSYVTGFANPYIGNSPFFYAALAVSIYQILCTIKRDEFTDEKETRIVHINPKRDEYPPGTDLKNRPIIRMRFDPLEYVREVWIGPHDNEKECHDAIATLLKAGVLRCDVKFSTAAK